MSSTAAASSRKAPATPTGTGTSKSKSGAGKVTASSATSRTNSPAGDSKTQEGGTANGSEGTTNTRRCKHCKKQVDYVGFAAHSKQCLRAKKERQRRKEEEKALEASNAAAAAAAPKGKEKADTGSRAVTVNGEDDTASTIGDGESADVTPKKTKKVTLNLTDAKNKNNKKRKAEDTPLSATEKDKPPSKKKKTKDTGTGGASTGGAGASGSAADSSTKAKSGGGGGGGASAKPKVPVDVEKQCGVILANGGMCARSLTCKSHTMGAKRAVPGRSLPYDTLLAQYQRKNQAKQQKAALASSVPAAEGDADPNAGGPIDSDEEREQVMAGIVRAVPRPLVERMPVSSAEKYRNVRLKEMVSQALGGSRGGGLFSTGLTAARPWNHAAEQNGESSLTASRRPSSIGLAAHITRNLM